MKYLKLLRHFCCRTQSAFSLRATLGAAERGFITTRGYRAAKRRIAPAKSIKDQLLIGDVQQAHSSGKLLGVQRAEMHSAMNRAGWDIGRDQAG